MHHVFTEQIAWHWLFFLDLWLYCCAGVEDQALQWRLRAQPAGRGVHGVNNQGAQALATAANQHELSGVAVAATLISYCRLMHAAVLQTVRRGMQYWRVTLAQGNTVLLTIQSMPLCAILWRRRRYPVAAYASWMCMLACKVGC